MKSEAMSIRPLGDKIILKRDDKEDQQGGIWLPDQTKIHGWAATVVKGNTTTCVKNGTRVFYLRKHTVCPFEDRAYVVTESKYLLATLVPSDDKSHEQICPFAGWLLVEPDVEPVLKDGIDTSPSRNATRHTGSGRIVRCGPDVTEVAVQDHVVFTTANLVRCVENDTDVVLLPEKDVLARLT